MQQKTTWCRLRRLDRSNGPCSFRISRHTGGVFRGRGWQGHASSGDPMDDEPQALNSAQAAAYIGVAPETLSRMRSAGRGPRCLVDNRGRLVRYRLDILRAYLAGDGSACLDAKKTSPLNR